jgi:hypothetical protein
MSMKRVVSIEAPNNQRSKYEVSEYLHGTLHQLSNARSFLPNWFDRGISSSCARFEERLGGRIHTGHYLPDIYGFSVLNTKTNLQ